MRLGPRKGSGIGSAALDSHGKLEDHWATFSPSGGLSRSFSPDSATPDFCVAKAGGKIRSWKRENSKNREREEEEMIVCCGLTWQMLSTTQDVYSLRGIWNLPQRKTGKSNEQTIPTCMWPWTRVWARTHRERERDHFTIHNISQNSMTSCKSQIYIIEFIKKQSLKVDSCQ